MKTLFDHIRMYCTLGNPAMKSLGAVLHKTMLQKGDFLITEGNVCNHVYFLEQGCLRGFYNLDGKEINCWFAFENSFVTSFLSFISRNPGVENIQLMEDAILWAV